MLQMIYGRAGTGKTEYLMQNLCQKAAAGHKVMLLVPEQFSFTSEKEVYRRLGSHVMMEHVEVLSFTRLAHLIFRSMGGMAGRRLDEPTRLLLMNAALDEVSSQLEIYAQSARSSSFLQLMVQTVAQFKFAGAGPEDLASAADRLPPDQVSRLGKSSRSFR